MLAALIVKEDPGAEVGDILFVWDVRTEGWIASKGDWLTIRLLDLFDLSTRRTTFVPYYPYLVHRRL